MEERKFLKQTGLIAIGVTFSLLSLWFLFSKLSLGYSGGPPSGVDIGINSRATQQMNIQPSGTTGTFVTRYGTQGVSGSGTVGYMSGTNTDYPRSEWTPSTGKLNFIGVPGFDIMLQIDGIDIPLAGSVSNKLDAIGGVGTNNTFYNPTLAGSSTIGTTSTITSDGTTFAATKVKYLADVDENIEAHFTTVEASVSGHAHAGTDSVKVSHNNVIGTGTNSHPIIDTFIAKEGQANGLATTNASNLVVQNPASASKTPGTSTIAMTGTNTDKLADSFLSDNITKLGTPTTDNINEGSTKLYYTNSRVNAAVGSLSVNTLNDVNIIFNENDFVKIVGGQLVAGSSTVTVAFSEVTGSATASQLPLISGLIGSATSAQLPTIIRLSGTTTEQAAGAFGQLYVQQQNIVGTSSPTYALLLRCNNAGTTTFTDSSDTPKTITAQGDAIGTSTTILEGGSYLGDGTTDALMVTDHADLTLGTGDFTIGFTFQFNTVSNFFMWQQSVDGNNNFQVVYENDMAGAGTDDIELYYVIASTIKARYRFQFNSPSTGTNYHFEFNRSGTNFYIFVNGVSQSLNVLTAVDTNDLSDIAADLYLMANKSLGASLNGKMDGFYYIKGLALHTSNFTSPTTERPENRFSIHSLYSAKYKDPVNGNTVFEILTPGTQTTTASYIYCNATTTVFGLGTNTAIVATTTAYSGWFDGAVRATAFNVASTEKIKENIKPIKIKPDLLEAESMAKQNYIAGAKVAWMAANQASYTTIVSETGTGSVTVIDIPAMETAYNNYIELAWASDMKQDSYVKNVQKTYEKGFWQMFDSVTPRSWNPKDNPALTRKGFVVEDMPDVVKGDDRQSIDPMALIAYISIVQQTLKADTIFALNTLKELITTGTVTQQKIDYVQDRLEVLNP